MTVREAGVQEVVRVVAVDSLSVGNRVRVSGDNLIRM